MAHLSSSRSLHFPFSHGCTKGEISGPGPGAPSCYLLILGMEKGRVGQRAKGHEGRELPPHLAAAGTLCSTRCTLTSTLVSLTRLCDLANSVPSEKLASP